MSIVLLKKKCSSLGITPGRISKGGLVELLKCKALVIGVDPRRLGLERVVFTKAANENLKWTSLTIKKTIPSNTFPEIYIYSSGLFLTDDGDVNPGPYHTICRILKNDGLIYLSNGEALQRRFEKDGFAFREFRNVGITFGVYSRRSAIKTPSIKQRITGKYRLLDIDWKIPIIQGITLQNFIEELDSELFINQFSSSVKSLLAYKKKFYLEKKGETKKKFDALRRKVKHMKSLEVDPITIKEMYPMYEFYAGFLFELDELIKLLSKKITPSKIKKDLQEAIYDPTRGLESLVGRNPIKNKLVSQLYAFSQNWKVFSGNFYNYALMGRSGTGKTRLGQVISFVFAKSGILATDHIYIVSRADLVGQYIGQTAPRTRSLLLSSLEGCIFIDEAYQLSRGCNKDFGHEAITEIVNFSDKYVGMSIIIVAGYQDMMKEEFFPSNEGLERRFPHQLILGDYTNSQLTDILIAFVDKSIPLSDSARNILFTMIVKVSQDIPTAFDKQAGDMLNLGGAILISIYSSPRMKWKDGDTLNNVCILSQAFNKFLQTKGFPRYEWTKNID